MIQLRCCLCNSPYVHQSSTAALMQSKRFPSVFIHATCRWEVGKRVDNLFGGRNEAPWNSLLAELCNDSEEDKELNLAENERAYKEMRARVERR